MKDKCEKDAEPESGTGRDAADRSLEETPRVRRWLVPFAAGAASQARRAREEDEDGEWPSLVFDAADERPARGRAGAFSLAVLPFETQGAAGEKASAMDMADLLTTRLGGTGVSVIRPASATAAPGVPRDPVVAGLSLDVKFVLGGRARQTPSGLRVETQLFSVGERKRLWQTADDLDPHDLIEAENVLSEKVARLLRPHVPGGVLRTPPRRRPTESTEAHRKFKAGRQQFNRFSEQGLKSALPLFEKAIERDPDFADAHACAAETLLCQVLLGVVGPEDGPARLLERSREYVTTALRLDPSLANAHTVQAFITLMTEYSWAEAARGFTHALELDANCAFAHIGLSIVFSARKMFDDALDEIDYALAIDPKSLICHIAKGLVHYQKRDMLAAWRQFTNTLELHGTLREILRATPEPIPPPDAIYHGLALANAGLSSLEKARIAARTASKTSHGHRIKLAGLAYVYLLLDRPVEAEEALRVVGNDELENCIPFHAALLHAARCERDPARRELHAGQAFRFLQLAVEKHDYWALWLATDPRLDALRSDHDRFDSLLRRVKLPPTGIL